MSYIRQSVKEKEGLLKKLQDLQRDLENNFSGKFAEARDIIAAWKLFSGKPHPEQQAVLQEWEKYYAAVKDTPIYALVHEQKEALGRRDMVRVRSLAAQAKAMKKNGDHQTLTKPAGIDPWEFNHGTVTTYVDLDKRIKELAKELSFNEFTQEKEEWDK